MDEDSIVILNSGGLDSLVVMGLAHKLGYKIVSLFVDYGHSSNVNDGDYAEKIAEHYKAEHHVETIVMRIWCQTDFFKGNLSKPVLPNRNFVLFSIAATYCDYLKIPTLGLAWDGVYKKGTLYSRAPDSHAPFANALRKAFDEGSTLFWDEDYHLSLFAPLLNKTKLQIATMGLNLKVPFEISRSCYAGERIVCGSCLKCKERAALENLLLIPNTI